MLVSIHWASCCYDLVIVGKSFKLRALLFIAIAWASSPFPVRLGLVGCVGFGAECAQREGGACCACVFAEGRKQALLSTLVSGCVVQRFTAWNIASQGAVRKSLHSDECNKPTPSSTHPCIIKGENTSISSVLSDLYFPVAQGSGSHLSFPLTEVTNPTTHIFSALLVPSTVSLLPPRSPRDAPPLLPPTPEAGPWPAGQVCLASLQRHP